MNNFILSNTKDGFEYTINYVNFNADDLIEKELGIGFDLIDYGARLVKETPEISAINSCKSIVDYYIERGGDKNNINIKLTKV